jgi:hypothetical protein
MKVHYIGMNGSSGCLPDSCNVYTSEQSAVESLTDLLELTEEQSAELLESGLVYCTQEQGADYASVTECSCNEPWQHQDGETEKQFRMCNPEFFEEEAE